MTKHFLLPFCLLLFWATSGFAAEMTQAKLAQTAGKIVDAAFKEPKPGTVHRLVFDGTKIPPEIVAAAKSPVAIDKLKLDLLHGNDGKFRLEITGDFGNIALGCTDRPWLQTLNGTVFRGSETISVAEKHPLLPYIRDDVKAKLPVIRNLLKSLELSLGAIKVNLSEKEWSQIDAVYAAFTKLELDTVDANASFGPNENAKINEVPTEELLRNFAALLNFATDRFLPRTPPFVPAEKKRGNPDKMTVLAKASNGHGLLAEQFGRKILFVEGTPQQMGAAQGELLKENIARLMDRVLYAVGGATTITSNGWFFNELAEIESRATPFMPERFFHEVDAMSEAAGLSKRDGRFGNMFPERFHCSGVAVRGKATKDGRVYHARVLDYMSDVLLQDETVLQVFAPKGYHRWVSHGYAGFVGTVTAINEKGLAMGEMGGRGEGDWDGMPMTFLMRDIMERAATVDEALAIIQSTKLTCEYYYVLSDASKNMVGLKCTPQEVVVLTPGMQHELLPPVPEDTVFISAGSRAEELSKRLHENFGKIDADLLIEIIKRPVAMKSNLHNAIFVPEDREIRVSDAGSDFNVTPACDMPYHTFRLDELFKFYEQNIN